MGPSFPLGQPQQGPMWGLTLSFLQLCNTESHLSCLLTENQPEIDNDLSSVLTTVIYLN